MTVHQLNNEREPTIQDHYELLRGIIGVQRALFMEIHQPTPKVGDELREDLSCALDLLVNRLDQSMKEG